jgi:hypothetical protein
VGCLTLGDPKVKFPKAPAKQARVVYEATCPASCTETFGGDITVFSAMIHMHKVGKEVWSTLKSSITGREQVRQLWFQKNTVFPSFSSSFDAWWRLGKANEFFPNSL